MADTICGFASNFKIVFIPCVTFTLTFALLAVKIQRYAIFCTCVIITKFEDTSS